MARAYGANAQLLGKFETVYGTPPSGNYIKFPFVSSDLGSEQGLIASDLLGQGRDPSQPIRDVSLRPGCDKKFSTCKDRYNNVKNFRGEPNVPGNDQVLAYPDGK